MTAIKLTSCVKVQGLVNGAGEHWVMEFTCDTDFNSAHRELARFVDESFTPGQIMYVSQRSISRWNGGCHFCARAYKDQDVMLVKLAYS